MKQVHYYVLAIALLAGSNLANAKDDKESGRVGGIRAGWHYSGLYKDGNIVPTTDPLQSFYIGVFRNNKIVPMLRFGSGLEYFQNGIQTDKDNKLVLHYLSVPLNLQVKLGPVIALTGFSPSFKVGEKIFSNGQKSSPSADEKSDWFDVPFHVGAGVKILFITIEARYHWGLLEVSDGYKNQYLQIGAGISF